MSRLDRLLLAKCRKDSQEGYRPFLDHVLDLVLVRVSARQAGDQVYQEANENIYEADDTTSYKVGLENPEYSYLHRYLQRSDLELTVTQLL